MSRLTKIAVLLAALVSVIALQDAVTQALTGHASALSDEPGQTVPWLANLGSAVHVLAYLAFVAVMVRYGTVIDAGRRVRTALRWSLIVAYGVIAVVLTAMEVTNTVGGSLGTVANVVFLVMLLGPPALGITMLAQGERAPSAFLMAASVPALGLMILLGFLAPHWAHPAYMETVVNFGLALLGVGASRTAPVRQPETAPV